MKIRKTLIFLICLALLTSVAWGVSSQTGKMQSSQISLTRDRTTFLDINELLCFVYNDGNFAYDNANFLGKTDGLYFPRGTNKTIIYAGGIWFGARVDGEVRTVVAEFGSEFAPGNMENGTFVSDKPDFKVYKITRGDTPETNADMANWPADQGAPVDDEGNPVLLGDQMCWSVYNDADPARHNIDAGSSDPLGLEIQQSTFAYGRTGALGQVIFMKFLIINEGGNTLEDTYVSLWADPDLGGSSDDLVGCDTILSLGYCYNDATVDNTYGVAAPAVGYDFFQGPIVEGDAGDSAKFMGEWVYGMKNLPMTSFNKYKNGTDPHSSTEAYYYMQGLTLTGNPLVDPNDDTTTYIHAGDPVTGEGWLDGSSADRRYMMTSGPFTMMPGDTQEVVAAIVVGQGADRLSSITAMKTNDLQAQTVFDLNFDIPSPPPNPIVHARAYDNAIDLVWSPADEEKNWPEEHYQDYISSLNQFFVFEGYNIYQGESAQGPWTKVMTVDLDAGESERTFADSAGLLIVCDDITLECDTLDRVWDFALIYGNELNNSAGGIETVIKQSGDETGLIQHLHIDRSFLDGGPITNYRPYYFAVQSYSVNIQEVQADDSVFSGVNFLGFNAASLENSINAVTVVPKSSGAVMADTASHVGPSQGQVVIEYINYTETEAAQYTVDFNADNSWNLKRGSTPVLSDQANQGGGYDYDIVDGLMVRVMGPDAGIAPAASAAGGGVIEIATAAGTIDPDNVFWSLNSTGDWYCSSDNDGSSDAARSRFNWRGHMGWESWEFRFTDEGSEYYNYSDDSLWGHRAPFEIWHFTEDAAEPDRRIIFEIIDDDASGGWSWSDRIYVVETEYSEPNPIFAEYTWDADFHLGRTKFNDNSGALTAPETGTIVRFNSTVPNGVGDSYTFTTKPVGAQDGSFVGLTLDNVLVVPNPYYNFNALETNQFNRMIKFTNLPPVECNIKIFNIAGDLVTEMVKEDIAAAEFVWDVKTDNGLYVASGIYIYYIEAEGVGDTFGKMVVFTEVEQLNTF